MRNQTKKRFLLGMVWALGFSLNYENHNAFADTLSTLSTTYNTMVTKFEDKNPTAQNLLKKGNFLAKLGRDKEALAAYDKIINTFGSDPFYSGIVESARQGTAKILYNKGVTLVNLGHIEQAISAYDDVILRFSGNPSLRKWVSRARANRDICLSHLLQQRSAFHSPWP
ncbi:MAG: hypothetical protein IJ934_00200 [Acetobacter sp.]|nr:hypothetical protein [Acetobacter sp.]